MSFNVLTAEMSHETNSFSRQETDEQAFRNRYVLMGADAIAERGQTNTELAGFLDAGRAHGWHVKHVLSASAGPSGKVRRTTFNWLSDPIISAIKQQPFDGLLLGLHGAMDLEFCEDGAGHNIAWLMIMNSDCSANSRDCWKTVRWIGLYRRCGLAGATRSQKYNHPLKKTEDIFGFSPDSK